MPATIRWASRLRAGHETYAHDIVGFRRDALHFVEQAGVDRMPLGLEDVERKGDIGRGEAGAVGETRLGPQQEAIGQLVLGVAHRPRDQAIDGIRFVAIAVHQGVETTGHAGRPVALLGKDIESVERIEILVAAGRGQLQGQQPALGRVRVDVGEMLEVGGQGEVAEGGEPVGFDSRRPPGRTARGNSRRPRGSPLFLSAPRALICSGP